MRFRKARSFLSAYSNDEVTGRKQARVRKQLDQSESLRQEAAAFQAIGQAAKKLPDITVNDDFNARLLDRIADERFAETRTKAMLPRTRANWWWRPIPVAVSAVMILLIAAVSFYPGGTIDEVTPMANYQPGLDNSYLTIRADSNPNLAGTASRDLSLARMVANVDRANQITNRLMRSSGFGWIGQPYGNFNVLAGNQRHQVPFNVHFYQLRPVLNTAGPATSQEGSQVY